MKIKDGASVEALIARADALEAVLRAILAEPHGCPQCDSGIPRSAKQCWPECGYGRARKLLETA